MTVCTAMLATALLTIGQADDADIGPDKMKEISFMVGKWETVLPDGRVQPVETELVLDGRFQSTKLSLRSPDGERVLGRVMLGWNKTNKRYQSTVNWESGDTWEHVWNKVGDKMWVVNAIDGNFVALFTVEDNDTLRWVNQDGTINISKRIR